MLSQTSFHLRRHSMMRPQRWHVRESCKARQDGIVVRNCKNLDDGMRPCLKSRMKMTQDDLAMQSELSRWLQNPPPRQLTQALRKHLGKKSSSWVILLFGLFFFLFGSVFCVIFLPWDWPKELSLDRSHPDLVDGIVTKTEATNMSINGVSVWRNEVTFQENGEAIISVGYTTGKEVREGESVKVRLHPEDVMIHCPQNMRMSKSSLDTAFVLLFPVLGIFVMITPWFRRRKQWRLYEQGSVADIRVMHVKPTNMHVNDERVHEVGLQYPHLPEVVEAKILNADDLTRLKEAHELGHPLRVIYNPQKPKRFAVL